MRHFLFAKTTALDAKNLDIPKEQNPLNETTKGNSKTE